MKLTKEEIKELETRPTDEYKRKHALNKGEGEQAVLGQSKQLSLMPFQVIIWHFMSCEVLTVASADRRCQLAL